MTSSVADTATLVHGYTLADIERCKHTAVRKHPSTVLTAQDQHEIAWFAIIDELYRSQDRPDWWNLVMAGIHGLQVATRQELKHRGINEDGGGIKTRFLAYWADTIESRAGEDSFSPAVHGARRGGSMKDPYEHVIEKMALPQVLAVLTGPEYQVIADLAAHGSRSAVIAATGIRPEYFDKRLKSARKRIVEVWLEPDTPVTPPKRADRDVVCMHGHPRAQHSYKSSRGLWICRKCVSDREKRIRARGDKASRAKHDPLAAPEPEPALTFAPPRDLNQQLPETGADVCWCGLVFGHDWPGKAAGGPHPAIAAA